MAWLAGARRWADLGSTRVRHGALHHCCLREPLGAREAVSSSWSRWRPGEDALYYVLTPGTAALKKKKRDAAPQRSETSPMIMAPSDVQIHSKSFDVQ